MSKRKDAHVATNKNARVTHGQSRMERRREIHARASVEAVVGCFGSLRTKAKYLASSLTRVVPGTFSSKRFFAANLMVPCSIRYALLFEAFLVVCIFLR